MTRVAARTVLISLGIVCACHTDPSGRAATSSGASTGLGHIGMPGFVAASPDAAKELALPPGTTPIDLAASSTGPEVALLLRNTAGKHIIVSWKAGDDHTSPVADLPPDFTATAIASHPSRHTLFVSGSVGGKSQIIALTNDGSTWRSTVIFETPRAIGRLIVGPRPFETSDSVRYRIFFAARLSNGSSSLRSVTENGKVEYQVAGPESTVVHLKDPSGLNDDDFQPSGPIAPSAVPLSMHPRGEPLVWQDRRGCPHALAYADKNWATDNVLSALPCDGSLSLTPNGVSYIFWKSGSSGLSVFHDKTSSATNQATAYTFTTAPVSTPDGKGVIGFVAKDGKSTIVYAPITVSLGDVANAWQFVGNACEEQLLTKNAGLFRERDNTEQLYSLYESYNYGGGVTPFLVTTDLAWENFGAAFNGVFIILERRRASGAFWSFVDAANKALASSAPSSRWGKAFAALADMHNGVVTGEAGHIAHDSTPIFSTVLDSVFNFAELKPRSHYATSAEMQEYFRGVHYFTEMGRRMDPAPLASLPADVQRMARDWIDIYRPFIALPRAQLVWLPATPASLAPYGKNPWKHASVFPLSWGLDNETLESTVYHSTSPPSERIAGPAGTRLFASGVDVAAAFGSPFARSVLAPDFAGYPPLRPVLDAVAARRQPITESSSLYDRWLDALSVEWADSTSFPGSPKDSPVWSAKRLQTGLASWATLREATILVNERAGGTEAGEGGFEELIPETPRGYVEPAPKTFEAIASLYDALASRVNATSDFGAGGRGEDREWKDEPLRQGITRRLGESAAEARRFGRMATKELHGEALTDSEYTVIQGVGGSAEHQLLLYKSLAEKDLGIPTPEPLPKVADVAGDLQSGLLEVAVGAPLEWHQIAPYFGRRQIVVGSTYSYYEFKSMTPYDNARWRKEIDLHARPSWIQPLIAPTDKQCHLAAPR